MRKMCCDKVLFCVESHFEVSQSPKFRANVRFRVIYHISKHDIVPFGLLIAVVCQGKMMKNLYNCLGIRYYPTFAFFLEANDTWIDECVSLFTFRTFPTFLSLSCWKMMTAVDFFMELFSFLFLFVSSFAFVLLFSVAGAAAICIGI